jgi:hypothetical protein
LNMDVQMSEAKTGTSCPSDPHRCRGVRETHDNVRRLGTGWCAGIPKGRHITSLWSSAGRNRHHFGCLHGCRYLGFVWNEIPRLPDETGAVFKVSWPADTGHYDAAQTMAVRIYPKHFVGQAQFGGPAFRGGLPSARHR